MNITAFTLAALYVGIGATLVMDLWAWLLRRLGVRTLDYALLGRWAGHGLRGRWRHQAIGQASPVRCERAWGWGLHYAVGILFAGLFLALVGAGWRVQPTLGVALAFGALTVLVPLCVMQPAMGLGVFARRTATPWRSCARSLMTHLLFGAGLYATAWVAAA
ncbi:DUF2938 domain-containing protein [Pseudomonas entomophila]|uniref:DUF2938 domain-containing protein n=1 Tax=Pseudomonas entomophila TaxID=312306 RepID=UPI0015E32427|nr:DUF2938 domain-containing protein [Pseudomonas entomophila]MBA1192607.1 DUF2938 domain-containing protein [Pseudomonas entomophila]